MATWDSNYLVSLFNRYASRPTVDEVSNTDKFSWLTEAQTGVVADIAARCPWVLYGPPKLMTTTDGGQTFGFGTDSNGYPVFPFGNVLVYPNLQAVPDNPYTYFMTEGTVIRIPNNGSYAGTLYWRGIQQPADITATTQPSLFPEASRNLIALDAAYRFMKTLNRPDLGADLQAQYDREFPRWLLIWRKQFASGGALRSGTGVHDDTSRGVLEGNSGFIIGSPTGGRILL